MGPPTNTEYLWFPLTDGQRVALMVAILVLILLYFIVTMIPPKRKPKDPWKNVRNRHRKKTPPSSKDGER